MKTIIYFFSGTGNSLAVAKKICTALRDCEIIPVSSFMNSPGRITPAAERVGIVCPVYFSGLPLMVAEWAARLNIPDIKYLFAVVTLGETGGGAALRQLDTIIKKNNVKGLDAGFTVKMPGNYIFMYASPEGRKREDILKAADHRVDEILPVIQRCERKSISRAVIGSLLKTVIYPWFSSHARARARQFSVTPACTSCGTCARVCPAENIELRDGKPVWKDRCEVCCACIHLCPVQAIEGSRKTEGRPRYRHPAVSTGELESRNMGKT